MKHIKSILTLVLSVSAFSTFAFAADTRPELINKANDAANVLREIVAIPDKGIPTSLLEKAVCVATIPDVVSGGIIFGARYGKGLVSCRTNGNWSKPSYVTIAGGSWGLQIGIQSIDLVLVFVNPSAIERFSHNNFTIGGDASVAAGPLGRDAQAGTDYKINSEIYSYSRARGLFAGLTFSGTAMTVDSADNAMAYGQSFAAHDLLTTRSSGAAGTPEIYANSLMQTVR